MAAGRTVAGVRPSRLCRTILEVRLPRACRTIGEVRLSRTSRTIREVGPHRTYRTICEVGPLLFGRAVPAGVGLRRGVVLRRDRRGRARLPGRERVLHERGRD